jgi:plastocyanin
MFRVRAVASSTLLLPLVAVAAAAPLSVTVNGSTMVFQDVPANAWYAQYIEVAAVAGVVEGYKDTHGVPTGFYGPGDNVTFAQAMKIAVESAGYPVEEYPASQTYTDHWAAPYMAVAADQGFASVAGPRQDIDRPATRAEVARIIVDAFKVAPGKMSDENYTDVSDETAHSTAIAALTRDRVVIGDTSPEGSPLHTYRPGFPVNRADAVKMAMTAWEEYGDRGEGVHPREAPASSAGSTSSVPGGTLQSSASSQGSGTQSSASSQSSVTRSTIVEYTDSGFEPAVISVPVGGSITFKNDTQGTMWIKGTAVGTSDSFDAGTSVGQGGVFTFKFTKAGSWTFSNYLKPDHTGRVMVQ